MTLLKNYLESNWKFDLSLLMVTFIMCISWINENDIRLLYISIFTFSVLIFKLLISVSKVNEFKNSMINSNDQNPTEINKINYYELSVKLIEDSKTLDILINNSLHKSIKKNELSNCKLITYKNVIWNWNWRGRGNDNYYQILIQNKNEFKILLQFKEMTWEDTRETIATSEFENLANEIAHKLNIKIKPAHNNSYKTY